MLLILCIKRSKKCNKYINRAIFPIVQDYCTFDGDSVQSFTNEGRIRASLTSPVSFNRLIYIEHMNMFVCWTAGTNKLLVSVGVY